MDTPTVNFEDFDYLLKEYSPQAWANDRIEMIEMLFDEAISPSHEGTNWLSQNPEALQEYADFVRDNPDFVPDDSAFNPPLQAAQKYEFVDAFLYRARAVIRMSAIERTIVAQAHNLPPEEVEVPRWINDILCILDAAMYAADSFDYSEVQEQLPALDLQDVVEQLYKEDILGEIAVPNVSADDGAQLN
jgi:hypothetical protein